MSDDTISRKATIDAMEGVDWYHINKDGRLAHGANSKDDEPLYKAKDVYTVLNTMPSAQPEKRTEERTETHACDCISRQAAIDALDNLDYMPGEWSVRGLSLCKDAIKALPPAQPEVLACGEGELIAQPEIVRCKDCKHSRFFDPCFYCYEFGGEIIVSENGYCYKAERRTDD